MCYIDRCLTFLCCAKLSVDRRFLLLIENYNHKNVSIDCCFYQDCESSAMCSIKNDAVPVEVDENLSHMRPVVVKALNLAQ